ncbi:hypothetical protein M9X92_011070 [Pyricularia oryzae]|nr:hypothetical protein M9X92_011070 [Pyricularia oryzae]
MAVVWLLSENIATKHEGAAVINRKRSRKLGVGFTLTLFRIYECWVLRVTRVSGW